MKTAEYKFKAKVWLYPGMAGWHFVSLNKTTSRKIRDLFGNQSRGFGSLPIKVSVGTTSWKTSIFPDKKSETYLIPIKKSVRDKEKISVGSSPTLTIEILV